MAQSTTSGGHGTSQSTSSHPPSTSIPVEMSDLDTKPKTSGGGEQGSPVDVSIPTTSSPRGNSSSINQPTVTPAETIAGKETKEESSTTNNAIPASESSTNALSSSNEPATTAPASADSPPTITPLDSVAIGPSLNDIATPVAGESTGPVLIITLLLASSGARHPYKIDEKYLTKRNVAVPGTTDSGQKDPFSISVYTLKELILREWREEWETAPSSPVSIRLIYFGRLLDDKTALKDCRFNADTANVVHISVRPQDIVDDEDASKGKTAGSGRGESESQGGCRCVIM